MFINNFDPVALTVFSLEIRWYSLAYIFGILIGWWLGKRIILKRFQNLKLIQNSNHKSLHQKKK